MSGNTTDLRVAFKVQADNCRKLESPFMGRLLGLYARRLTPNNIVAQRLFDWRGDLGPFGESVPLRMAGALHALALEKISQPLIDVYPPNHDTVDDDTLWHVVETAMVDHADFILARLQSPPQTNEVRRSSALLPGFLRIAESAKWPFVLSEVGASAGLNLLWDHYHFKANSFEWSFEWGDQSSQVKLTPEWRGSIPSIQPISIQERCGCDLRPIDASHLEERKRLLSYIWPDQTERLELIRASLECAALQKPKIEKADAIDWLTKRLAEVHEQGVHVIYHTIMWQYMSAEQQAQGEALTREAGSRATITAPLAWLRLEADGNEPSAALTLTQFPDGTDQHLGRADYHGRWVKLVE